MKSRLSSSDSLLAKVGAKNTCSMRGSLARPVALNTDPLMGTSLQAKISKPTFLANWANSALVLEAEDFSRKKMPVP